MRAAPPETEAELLRRARALAGRTLPEVAAEAGLSLPDLRRHKGFIGELLERVLGASGSSRAEPDFPQLGVELKSLPVDAQGRPQESTWVCTAPLDVAFAGAWADSWVRRKLSRVLFIPVVELAERTFGAAFLWVPDAEEDALLHADWAELAEAVALGEHWRITGRMGKALQVRPKGASSGQRAWVMGEEDWVSEMKRGFYLRASFTGRVLGRAVRTR
jgi:DNA mismatch repair protein MutH